MKSVYCTLLTVLLAAGAAAAQSVDLPEGKSLAEVFEQLLPGMGTADLGAQRGPQQDWQAICMQLSAPGNEAPRAEACRLMAAAIGAETPVPARVWLIKQLEYIGGEESVEALAAAADDANLLVRDAACRALARNPAPAAGDALRAKLQAGGDAARRVALIHALGYRTEAASVDVLAAALRDGDAAVVTAAAAALGTIATPAAADALAKGRAGVPTAARRDVGDALLRCADRLRAAGDAAKAAAIYKDLYRADEPARLGALVGLLGTAGDDAGKLMLEVLAGDDLAAQRVAIAQMHDVPPGALKALCDGLATLSPEGQVRLIGVLAVRGDRAALPAVLAAAGSDDPQVSETAIAALGRVGDASVLPRLVEMAIEGGERARAARAALDLLGGDDVDAALADYLKKAGDAGQRMMYLEILERRRAVAAVPAVLEQALGSDDALRRRAMAALSQLASPQHVPAMIDAMVRTSDASARDEAERAIAAVCLRTADAEKQADPVLAVYVRAGDALKNELLPLLGRIGGPKALEVARQAVASTDPERYDAGVKALSNWPDAAVAEDLLRIAASARDRGQQVRALRAAARVAVLPGIDTDAERLAVLQRAMQLATRDEDRSLVLERATAIRTIETVRFVAPLVDHPQLSDRACRTLVELAHHSGLRNPHQEEFNTLLEKVIRTTKDEGLANRARGYIAAP